MLEAECSGLGIKWLPQHFRSRPKLVAPFISIIQMLVLSIYEVKVKNIRLIHSRSYVPTFVALIIGFLTDVPFIFDMRALWPEELITAGRLKRGSLLHKLLAWSEKTCLRRADAIIALTHSAVKYLNLKYPDALTNKEISVIPTCVDLERFKPCTVNNKDPLVGCLGSVLSGWFKFDLLCTFLSAATLRDLNLKFQITTKDDHDKILLTLRRYPNLLGKISLNSVSHDKVPEILRQQLYSIMFYAGGEISELGRSPPRMAEILATGIPVVANKGVGDVESLIQKYKVGVVLKGTSSKQIENALDELEALLTDQDLSNRCRNLAEEYFSLDSGILKYLNIYSAIIKPEGDSMSYR